MTKLSNRERFILIVLAGVIIIAGIWFFLIKPMNAGKMDIDQQLRLSHERFNKAHQLIAQKPSLTKRESRLKELIQVTGSEGGEMSSLVAYIEGMAKGANVRIINIQPQRASAQDHVIFFSVELQVEGVWADIVKFIDSLQREPEYLFINDVNLEKYSDVSASLREEYRLRACAC